MVICPGALTTVFALAALSTPVAAKSTVPHFKWGQTKETLFISFMVKNLDPSSVDIKISNMCALGFQAKSAKGEVYAVTLDLREDVTPGSMKWEVSGRPDKWGDAVVVTVYKANKHRWDTLVTNPKLYKGLLDKDWSREDQNLEPEEELPYLEDNSPPLVALTSKSLAKYLKTSQAVIANIRYPWCDMCKTQDETFVKAAKAAKARSKKNSLWKKLTWAVLDPRAERDFARPFEPACDYNCTTWRVLEAVDEPALKMESAYTEDDLLTKAEKYLRPAIVELKAKAEVEDLKKNSTVVLGSFKGASDKGFLGFKYAARQLRGEGSFAVVIGEEDGAVEVFPNGSKEIYRYKDGFEDMSTFSKWVKPRLLPLLGTYDWQAKASLEKLGLPLAKLWLDDAEANPSLDKVVRYAVKQVAKQFVGRIVFSQLAKGTNDYELRDFGLDNPKRYPSFGIQSNASYNGIKYSLDKGQDFWTDGDEAVKGLADFCSQVLAGTWPEAHESAAPQEGWTKGQVKNITWKTYSEMASPEQPLLLEVYGRYRQNNEDGVKKTENLATALESYADSFTVASYDTSDNYLPPEDFSRMKYSSDTEWYWVPKAEGGAKPKIVKLTKPKKDADLKSVLEFLKKSSGLDINVEDLVQKHAELMKTNAAPAPEKEPGESIPEDMEDGEKVEVGGKVEEDAKVEL